MKNKKKIWITRLIWFRRFIGVSFRGRQATIDPFVRLKYFFKNDLIPRSHLHLKSYCMIHVTLAPLHKICVWTQVGNIKRNLSFNQSESRIKDLRSNATFMQWGHKAIFAKWRVRVWDVAFYYGTLRGLHGNYGVHKLWQLWGLRCKLFSFFFFLVFASAFQ